MDGMEMCVLLIYRYIVTMSLVSTVMIDQG